MTIKQQISCRKTAIYLHSICNNQTAICLIFFCNSTFVSNLGTYLCWSELDEVRSPWPSRRVRVQQYLTFRLFFPSRKAPLGRHGWVLPLDSTGQSLISDLSIILPFVYMIVIDFSLYIRKSSVIFLKPVIHCQWHWSCICHSSIVRLLFI